MGLFAGQEQKTSQQLEKFIKCNIYSEECHPQNRNEILQFHCSFVLVLTRILGFQDDIILRNVSFYIVY